MHKVVAMRSLDESCLAVPEPIGPRQINRLRERERVSQPVFAWYLNISKSIIEKWEAGEAAERLALKLRSIMERSWLKMLA